MGYIILETEVEYYRCSVLYGTQMNTIHNSAGQNRFIGTDMFSDRNTVESVLNEIKIEIMQRGFSNIDGIILIHPCNISARSYALLYTSCKNCFGFKHIRTMTHAIAEMLYLCGQENMVYENEGMYSLFLEHNGAIEYLQCEFADGILEILQNERYGHLPSDFYKSIDTDVNHKIVFVGGISSVQKNNIITGFKENHREVIEFNSEKVLQGGRLMARKLYGASGRIAELLLLSCCHADYGLRLKDNEFSSIMSNATSIPAKRSLIVQADERLETNAVTLRIGTIQRGFDEISFDLSEFNESDALTFSIDVDANSNTILLIKNEKGIQKEISLWDDLAGIKQKVALVSEISNERALQIIETLDNLERSISYAQKIDQTGFVDGLIAVKTQLLKLLADCNIQPIEAVGQIFDVNYHNAVDHIVEPSLMDNVVVTEYRKGYIYGNRVLRYSDVVVAN